MAKPGPPLCASLTIAAAVGVLPPALSRSKLALSLEVSKFRDRAEKRGGDAEEGIGEGKRREDWVHVGGMLLGLLPPFQA